MSSSYVAMVPEYVPPTPVRLRTVNGESAELVRRIDDGYDHSLAIVTYVFDHHSRINPRITQGQAVHYWGNPGQLRNILRIGYVVGARSNAWLIDINGWYGDSGAGVFNERGEVITSLNRLYVNQSSPIGGALQFMEIEPLMFTNEDLAAIR